MDIAQNSAKNISKEEKDYIYAAYEEICKLSKEWKKQMLTNREYQFIRNESDISDGIRYIKTVPKYHWMPIGKIKEALTTVNISRHVNKTGGPPVSFLQCFDLLALMSTK